MKSFIKYFLLLLLTGYALNAKAAVGATCTTGSNPDDGCADDNAECTGTTAKTCTCKDNYEVEGTACVLSLGKTCEAGDTCVANSECTGNPLKCTCEENYEAEGTKCVLSLGKTCKDGDTCVANAECAGTTDKKCTCKANYTAKDNKCESNATNNDTSGSSFLKVFVISFLSLLF